MVPGWWRRVTLRGATMFVLNRIRYWLSCAFRRVRINEFLWQDRGAWAKLRALQVPALLELLERGTVYSLVVPVYKTPLPWLKRCVGSVQQQKYPHWQLVLVDDASGMPDLSDYLQSLAALDPRIILHVRKQGGGIVAATNDGIGLCTGHFVGFLDHDDDLTPDALLWMEYYRQQQPGARWLYSDEIILDNRGLIQCIHFKPDFSPEQLLSIMYTGHLSFYAREWLQELGGLRPGFDGSQDHDLALRASETALPKDVVHVPHPLYVWRAVPGSAAHDAARCKPYAAVAGAQAVQQAFARRGVTAEVTSHPQCPTLYQSRLIPSRQPSVAILIATRNRLELLRPCIESLHRHAGYPQYRVIVIDNASDCPQTLAYLAECAATGVCEVFRYPQAFNHSAMHNALVAGLQDEFVVLLNNDVLNFSPGWLAQLVAVALTDERIAAVGCKLTFANGSLQHAGVATAIGGLAGHPLYGQPAESMAYFGRAQAAWNPTAVTGALALVRRIAYQAVGGLDATHFPTSYNDVDFCLRLRGAGYRCVYWPGAWATHLEGGSRPVSPQEREFRKNLQARWMTDEALDPAWSPHVNPVTGDLQLKQHWLVEQTEKLLALEAQAALASQARRPPTASELPTGAEIHASQGQAISEAKPSDTMDPERERAA